MKMKPLYQSGWSLVGARRNSEPRALWCIVENITESTVRAKPPEGAAFHITGEFREVEPQQRLVYTFEYEEPDPDDRETVVALSFVDVAKGTRLVLDHGPFATRARRALHERGWTETLDGLERFLGQVNADFRSEE
jgi:uncharacterized protein YndB with AHSA1/START domain